MNCELIFYRSSKTNLCERALRSSIEGLDLRFSSARFSTSPESLGTLIIDAFEVLNVVFVVGGLSDERNGVENVLSKALANKSPDDLKKLRNPLSRSDGYLVRQGGQLLVVLPDEPEEIKAIFDGALSDYIKSFAQI